MSQSSIVGICEITINSALKRLSKLEGDNKKALESEFQEWINAIECEDGKINISLRRKLLLITLMKKDEYLLDFEVNMLSGGMLTEKKDVLLVNCVKLYVPHKQLL